MLPVPAHPKHALEIGWRPLPRSLPAAPSVRQGAGRRGRCQACQQVFARGPWRRRRAKAVEDRLDAVMQRVVCVEDRGAVQQTDTADDPPQHRVVVGRGGQRADEGEQG